MPRSLPPHPNLDHLKKQAKELLHKAKEGDSASIEFLGAGKSRAASALTLADAQRAIAREYGFASWAKLRHHVESLTDARDPLEAVAAAIQADDVAQLRRVLSAHPELKRRLNDALPGGAFGATALLCALQRENRQMIEALLNAGANINARSHWWAGGFGILDSDHGLTEFLIERGAMVDAHAAARLGRLERLRELVAGNPELVHARGGDGQTPLHFASTVAIAEFLLNHGADIDARDVDHESTPAQYMVRDRQEVAQYLVSRGCHTDILMAAALGDLELTRRRLDADPACIRTSVSDKYFPKRNPRAGGHIYIWTLGQNKTAHLVARDFGREEVLRLLMDRTPEDLKLALACELGDEAWFAELLAARPGLIENLPQDTRRKLADAAQANNARAVRLMLDAGWPVDARGQHGATALHWACFHGNAGMVGEILRHHPPLEDAINDFKSTPLGWATYGSEHGWRRNAGDYAATVELLCAAGAKLPAQPSGSDEVKKVLRRYSDRPAGGA